MKIIASFTLLVGMITLFTAASFLPKKPAVLIFSKTNGYHHACIPVAATAIMKLGMENGFDVDSTTDSLQFTKKNLKKYDAVIFLCPTGEVLGNNEQAAFKQYIEGGGGFVGLHAATDCGYTWAWYGQLVGAYFKSHPKQQEAKLNIVDKNFPATQVLPDTWVRKDEWYNLKDISPDITVLIKLDESSYTGGENNGNHPIAWYHNFDGGRAFYTGLGHTDESWADPLFLKHILGGIEWAITKPQPSK